MSLIADRFLALDTERALDLATGARVVLRIAAAGTTREQVAWSHRCETLLHLHHPFIAPLVDYGAIGASECFEAWRCGGIWRGAAAEAARACVAASRFLESCGLTVGRVGPAAVHASATGALVLPDERAGFTYGSIPSVGGREEMHGFGLSTVERRATAIVADALAGVGGTAGGNRSRVLKVFGGEGTGRTVALHEIARCARLHGLVPIAVDVVRDIEWPAARTVCLIADRVEGGWPALVAATLAWPAPHMLVVIGDEESRGMDSVGLEPVSPDALVRAIRPVPADPALIDRISRAARRADGNPGTFARILWCRPAVYRRQHSTRGLAAAEQAARYSPDEASDAGSSAIRCDAQPADEAVWPAPGELAALRRRMAAAVAALDAGRHAVGIRQLRHVIGALARRRDWSHVVAGYLALAPALLRRGRPKSAHASLGEARAACDRGRDERALRATAILSAEAWVDRARLAEAEACASTVGRAAMAAGDGPQARAAGLALARCLFWGGRYDEAHGQLEREEVGESMAHIVRARTLAAKVAVGQRDLARALAAANDALERARDQPPGIRSGASNGVAFVYLAIGDLDAVRRHAAEAIESARAAHDPLRAVRARLLLGEAERRQGRHGAAVAITTRLRRLGGEGVPPIIAARCRLLEALAASPDEHGVADRIVAATSLEALRLFGPAEELPCAGSDRRLSDTVDILRLCQAAEDERAVLARVCAALRRRLRGAGVAIIGAPAERGTDGVLASDGARVDVGAACRAIEARIVLVPQRVEGRIEAAAPVLYGGRAIAAVAARWTLGGSVDRSPAADVLTLAATAVAPIVATLLTRQAAQRVPAGSDLLGVSHAMSVLRQAIARAAAAPFPVLIEGESGSGKELVARSLHQAGPRRSRPFCTLNCAALPDDLVEAELFGHARGAFTGAVAERPGVFEDAHGGTLLLDEIGELSLRAQAKVLRVVQEGELRRVGENVSRRVDVRLLAATNRDLREEVAAGRFRLDLLYRLDVIRISVAPLRERRDDIPILVEHLWRDATARVGSTAVLSAATMAALARYDWPGNVRELQNVLAALAVRSARRGVVPPTALPAPLGDVSRLEPCRLEEARKAFDGRFVRAALARTGGHRGQAATELGLSRQGLTKLMARLGISEGPSTTD